MSLLSVLAMAVGAGIAGVHAVPGEDALVERFDRWVFRSLVLAALLLGPVT
jgi:hypothetical protein